MGDMVRAGDMLEGIIARFAEMAAMGELGDDEEAEREEERTRQDRMRAKRREYERQLSFLSRRHVEAARAVLRGEAKPSLTWEAVHAALSGHKGASVLLHGATGAGKTTAATGLAMLCAHAGGRVLSLAASRADRIAKYPEAMEEAVSADLLILDELHRVMTQPDWIATKIYGLIDQRYQDKRQTIGLATVSQDELLLKVGTEIVERFDLVIVAGESQSLRG